MATKNPFPGMNPWLELRWGDVHMSLIAYSRDSLQEALPDDLRARGEERVFLETYQGPERSFYPDVHISERSVVAELPPVYGGTATLAPPIVFRVPDVEITEPFLEIVDASNGGRVVTTIEFLSRSNKRPGDGHDLYLRKQRDCRDGGVNIVEIDLLRGGASPTIGHRFLKNAGHTEPYHASVWRASKSINVECYPAALRDRLPMIAIPLREHDADVPLDLQALVDLAFLRGRHDDIDYSRPLDPPLCGYDAEWSAAISASRK